MISIRISVFFITQKYHLIASCPRLDVRVMKSIIDSLQIILDILGGVRDLLIVFPQTVPTLDSNVMVTVNLLEKLEMVETLFSMCFMSTKNTPIMDTIRKVSLCQQYVWCC